jgi:hypothetical protein
MQQAAGPLLLHTLLRTLIVYIVDSCRASDFETAVREVVGLNHHFETKVQTFSFTILFSDDRICH